MRNIKLTIEYDGTEYEGWQVQNSPRKTRTIQNTIEKVLEHILNEKVKLTGSGRTDAGVHARAQVANFFTSSRIPLKGLQKGLNALLPPDIAIIRAQEVPESFHSRYSAKWKLYLYVILNRAFPSALKRNLVYFCEYPLDVPLMRMEAQAVKGRHDFRSFHAADKEEKSSVRTVRKVSVKRSGDEIVIEIEANGFLKNMVRTIVGTLVEIGRGRFPPGSMKKILAKKDRKCAGPTAPGRGLFLVRVGY